ncbi:hypothetical protein POTOM_001013 [Populus tomentosa]|uniref:LUC7 related protein n=1 Tax=Populus tomentosa TaxID=118781 RepID=A0A8X8DH55_POPTO|nr:hypothetical protein POTOM_001013 [Populus tomentosa]
MDLQRAMLDELMGADRNLTEEERKDYKEITWDSKEVCAYYMARFCPHDLFVNTKSDIGPCDRVHDPKLKERNFPSAMFVLSCRALFEKSPRHDAYLAKFEAELAQRCEKLVMELDRRVRRGRERLAQGDEPMPPPLLSADKSERLSVVEEKIKNLLVQVEALGEVGKVDEAQALMKKVDELNAEKALIQCQNDKVLVVPQEKKMALCEICGSFLVANDVAERTQSHITGKQHIGYGMVRDYISEYKVIEIGIMIEIEKGSGTGTEIVKGQGSGMVGVVEMIGGLRMEEMVAGIGTVIGAGHVPLSGMVAGGHLEVQFTHIRGLCS